MKKILLVLTLVLFEMSGAFCATSDEIIGSNSIIEAQNRIDKIGFNILNSNGIETRTVFDLDIKRHKNAYSSRIVLH